MTRFSNDMYAYHYTTFFFPSYYLSGGVFFHFFHSGQSDWSLSCDHALDYARVVTPFRAPKSIPSID